MEELISIQLERRDIEDLYAHLRRHYGPLDSGTVSRICYALECTFDNDSAAAINEPASSKSPQNLQDPK